MSGALLYAAALLFVVGCNQSAREVAPAPPAPDASASAGPSPSVAAIVDAGDADAGDALVYARVERELDERCDPKKHPASETSAGMDPESTLGFKFTAVWVGTCMRELVEHEVDAARTRLRATSPARAEGLATEQAAFLRYGESICRLAEKAQWFDLENGKRYDGTLRGIAYWSSWFKVHHERLFYVRAIAAGDAAAAAARVRELATAGGAARKEITQMRSRAQALWARAPAQYDGKTYPVSPLSKEDLRQVISFAAEADRGARALALSTCAWEALAAELGGKQACARNVELYYLAHWSEEPIR